MASATRSSPLVSSITGAGAVRAPGEIFGVSAEGDAGLVDHALVNRRGDDGVELPGERAVDGALEQRQHVARVGRIRAAGDARCAERQMRDSERTGCMRGAARCRSACVAGERDRKLQLLRTRGEQRAVAEAHQLARQLAQGERQAQLRADAGGLSRGQSDAGNHLQESAKRDMRGCPRDGFTASPDPRMSRSRAA